MCAVYGSLSRCFTKKKKLPGFTQDVQLDLGGLLASAVCGHTCVSALIIKLGLLDPEGCCVFDPDRKSIVKPRDLGARLSLRHTGQSHSLTNQSLQHGGARLDPRLGWEERTKFLKAFRMCGKYWLLSAILGSTWCSHMESVCIRFLFFFFSFPANSQNYLEHVNCSLGTRCPLGSLHCRCKACYQSGVHQWSSESLKAKQWTWGGCWGWRVKKQTVQNT